MTPPESPRVPREPDDVDGAYEAFRERVTWFYRNAPECQEARKHSFGRQADVAFLLAMKERTAAFRSRLVETAERVRSERHVPCVNLPAYRTACECVPCTVNRISNAALDQLVAAMGEEGAT